MHEGHVKGGGGGLGNEGKMVSDGGAKEGWGGFEN